LLLKHIQNGGNVNLSKRFLLFSAAFVFQKELSIDRKISLRPARFNLIRQKDRRYGGQTTLFFPQNAFCRIPMSVFQRTRQIMINDESCACFSPAVKTGGKKKNGAKARANRNRRAEQAETCPFVLMLLSG
jgi:hypothetical protein